MRCEKCGTANVEGSDFCKECGERLGEAGEPTALARFLSTAWSRKGPVLMALSTAIMMGVVFAPWAFLKIDIFGFRIVSNSYNGWEIFIPRILLFLSLIPLLISLLMVAGIGTRRRVVETHICTFFGGVIFTVWIIIYTLSYALRALLRNVRVLEVGARGGQVATIILFALFILGVIVTTYDRGREMAAAHMEG